MLSTGFLQNDRQVGDNSRTSHHSRCLLLITHLLSCCKHPVEILFKAACKYSSSCYGMSTGFLQNDRQVIDKFRAFHHSICLLIITHLPVLLQASCENSCCSILQICRHLIMPCPRDSYRMTGRWVINPGHSIIQ